MRRRNPPIAVIGSGRLASTLLPLLARRGWRVAAVASRSAASARRLSRAAGGARVLADPVEAASLGTLVLLAVPDRELAPLARRLAGSRRVSWRGRVVLHFAGAFGPEAIRPLARAGAAVGVLHPLQCLGVPSVAAACLPGSAGRIEGSARAAAIARRIARDLGIRPLRFPRRLAPRERAAYHAAASLVANDLVALLALGTDLLRAAGLSPRAALRALVPLARGTVGHVAAAGLEGAMTGPIARGDAATVTRQLRGLRGPSPLGAEVHRLLSRRLLRAAVESGLLPRGAEGAVLRALGGAPRAPRSRGRARGRRL